MTTLWLRCDYSVTTIRILWLLCNYSGYDYVKEMARSLGGEVVGRGWLGELGVWFSFQTCTFLPTFRWKQGRSRLVLCLFVQHSSATLCATTLWLLCDYSLSNLRQLFYYSATILQLLCDYSVTTMGPLYDYALTTLTTLGLRFDYSGTTLWLLCYYSTSSVYNYMLLFLNLTDTLYCSK